MQQDANKTIAQLSDELRELRQRNLELEASLVKAKEEAEHLSEDNVSYLEKEIQKITDEVSLEIDNLGKKKDYQRRHSGRYP